MDKLLREKRGKELCQCLAIRYGYADDEAILWIERNIVPSIRADERKRIINYLQELIELSQKVKEPAIKIRMMDVLQALKGKLPEQEEKR